MDYRERRTVEIVMDNSKAAKTIKEIDNDIRTLGNHIVRNLKPGTLEFETATKRLRELKEQGRQWRAEMNLMGLGAQRLKSEMRNIMIGVLGGNLLTAGASGVVNFFKQSIDSARTLSDAIADVQKVTGLTENEFEELDKKLSEIDTRKSRKELLELAVAAGKAGEEGVDAISEFVRQANIIDVALGEDLGEGAITQISKMSKIFNVSMLEIASGINEIGAKSEANEAYLVNFAYRLAGVSNTVKISAADVLGYGSVLDQMGLQVEMSSTALNGFFVDFVKNTQAFEEAANMTAGSLQKIIEQKGTNEGFLAFLQALKEANPEAQDFLRRLEEIGINGDRGSQVFLALSNNIEKVRAEQNLANKAIKENESVLNEYYKKNENFAANYDKAIKTIHGALLPMREAIAEAFSDGITWLSKNTDAIFGVVKMIFVGVTAWGAYKIASAAAAVAQRLNIQAIMASNTMLKLQEIAITSAGIAQAIFTGNLKKLRQEWQLLNVLMKTSPWGIALAGLAAVTTTVFLFGKRAEETNKILNEARGQAYGTELELDRLNKIVQDNTKSEYERQTALLKMREIMPDYLKHLSDEEILTGRATVAVKKYVEEMYRAALATGYRNKVSQLSEERVEQEQVRDNLRTKKEEGGVLGSGVLHAWEEDRLRKANQRIEAIDKEIKKLQDLQTKYEAPTLAQKYPTVQGGPPAKGSPAADASPGGESYYGKLTKEQEKELAKQKKEQERHLKEREKLEKQHQNEMAKLAKSETQMREDELQESLNNLEKWRNQVLIINADLYAEGHISEEQFHQRNQQIQSQYLEAKKIAYQDYGLDVTDIELDISQEKLRIKESAAEAEKRIQEQLLEEERRNLEARNELAILLTEEGSQARLEAELNALRSKMEQELELAELTEIEKEAIRERYRQAEEDLKDEKFDADLTEIQNTTQELSNVYLDLVQARVNREMAANKKKENAAISDLDKRLNAGLISQEEYVAEKERIENESLAREKEIKRDAFKKQQNAAFIENIILTALAVIKGAPNPFLMGLAAATGLANGILIKSQQPPEYGKGVLLDGPLHSDPSKGMPIVHPYTGEIQSYVEGGEAVLSRSTVKNNWPIVSRLLDTSMNRGGASLTEIPKFNFGGITRAVNFYANGGVLSKANPEGKSDPQNTVQNTNISFDGFAAAVKEFAAVVHQFEALTRTKLQAELVLDQYRIHELKETMDDLEYLSR